MGRLTEGGGHSRARPGDVWHIEAKDSRGNVAQTYVVRRTERDFVFDLCDAYNEAMPDWQRQQGKAWFVHNGSILLGTHPDWDAHLHRESMRQLRSIDRAELERAA